MGNWIRIDDRNYHDKKIDDGKHSFSKLEFMDKHDVVGFVYMAHVFKTGGEALESGKGHYKWIGDKLSIETPPQDEIDGWPDSIDDDHRQTYDCMIVIAPDAQSLTLADCPLRGRWRKETR